LAENPGNKNTQREMNKPRSEQACRAAPAAEGKQDVAEVSTALRIMLQLEGVKVQ
jgi:hypothetical protein